MARSIAGAAAACAALAVGAPVTEAGMLSYQDIGPPPPPPPPDVVDPAPPPPRALSYIADLGPNRLLVSLAPGLARFSDDLVPAGATDGALDNVQSISIDLGGDDDAVTVGAGLPPTAVDGGAGEDRADYAASTAPETIALGGPANGGVSFTGVEDATGGDAGDTITGTLDPNSISGRGGGDVVDAAAGADHVAGGPGADTLNGGDGADVLHGDDDADTLDGGADADTLFGDGGADKIVAAAGDDDILAADGVSDTIDCGAGDDSVAADLGGGGAIDAVDVSCETVTGLVAQSTGSAGTPEPAPQSPGSSAEAATPTGAATLPVPVLADAIAAPGDVTAPSARLRVAVRQRLATALARGVVVPVSCSEACGISATLVLDRSAARRLGIAGKSGPTVLGAGSARTASAGSRAVRVRLSPDARRALKRAKSVKVTVQVLVSDATGNGTLLQRRVTLGR